MQTNGWDTVYALSFACLNQNLAQKSLGFPNQISDRDPTSPFTITAQLGAWQVGNGSSAQILSVTIPIASGTLEDQDKGTFPLAGINLSMDVALEILSQGQQMSLKFNLQAVNPVQVVNPGNLSELQQLGLLDAAAAYLSANAASIDYEFASINAATQNAPAWLVAQASNYTTVNGFLVILCSTKSSNIAALPPVADPSMIAAGDTAAFLMSGDLFLTDVVLPGLATSMGIKTPAQPFIFNPGTHAIENNGEVELPGVKKGLITYTPKLTSYSMTVTGANLVSYSAISCSAGLGASANVSITANNTVQFDAASKTLQVVADPNPTIHKDNSIPWYELMMGIVFEILVPILVNGVATAVTKDMSNVRIAGLSTQSVAWTGAGNFEVTNGGINDAVYLQGAWG